MAVTVSVAIFYPNVSTVLSILGGLCSVSICYTIPLYSHLKLSEKHWTAWENLWRLMFFSCLIVIGYSSVVSTVVMLAQGEKYLGDRPDILSKQ